MRSESRVSTNILWVVGLVLVVVAAVLSTATMAQAQVKKKENDDDQYGSPSGPKGPIKGVECKAAGNNNGVFDAGDTITYPGEFTVAPGASVVIDDEDGTVGTFVDGKNAKISSGKNGITVTLTGSPTNVSGGNGVLNDTVCKSIVASTGIVAGPALVASSSSSGDSGPSDGGSGGSDSGSGGSSNDSSGNEGPLARILPETGGPMLVLLGALAAIGTGLTLLRHRSATRR